MSFYPYSFNAPIMFHDVGSERYAYKVVFLPPDITDQLPLKTYPRLRIQGEINEQPYEGSCTPVRGQHYLLLSSDFLKSVNAQVGDDVDVRFAIADQDAVDVPTRLREALWDNPKMQALWDNQTPGKQRGLAYMVATAKTEPTIAKRIDTVFDILSGKRDARGKLIDPD